MSVNLDKIPTQMILTFLGSFIYAYNTLKIPLTDLPGNIIIAYLMEKRLKMINC